jgi:hypothetical protein
MSTSASARGGADHVISPDGFDVVTGAFSYSGAAIARELR